MYAFTTSCSVALFLIVLLLLVFWKHIGELLKDDSILPMPQRSYSLSRTIMFYWTLIIVFSVCYIGIVSDNMPTIDSGVLILMGIVVGTTTTGRVIDNTQQQTLPAAKIIQNDPTQAFSLTLFLMVRG